MQIHILTLFPEFFRGPLETSILARARDQGHVEFQMLDIRDFTENKHRQADDTPYGGGAGMVMKPGPVVRAIEYARESSPEAPRILLTPQGERFEQETAGSLADEQDLILVCGRYEGVDERVREGWIDRELSIGDYVLPGGEAAALCVTGAVVRLLPDVLGNQDSLDEESFTRDRLEYPHYTRPQTFRGREVPDVLLSGDHQRVADWRRKQAETRTAQRRPDLLEDEENGETDET